RTRASTWARTSTSTSSGAATTSRAWSGQGMRSVSHRGELGRPDGFDAGIAPTAALDRARDWLGGGRFWSVALVLLLTLTVARSTATVHWVDGIDVIVPIALFGAVVMSVLALTHIREPIGLGIGGLLAP